MKSDEGRSPNSSNGEIGGWKTIHTQLDSVLGENGAQWNATSGRFKADEDGFYLVAASVLTQHSGSAKVTMNALLHDGQSQKIALTTFHPVDSRGGQYVNALTIAGITRLKAEQSISISVAGSPSLEVLPNSSFSVVLISRWNSDYAAGFVAHAPVRASDGVVIFWKTAIGKNLLKKMFDPVDITESGLYFLQSVVPVEVSREYTVFSSLKIDAKLVLRGVTSLMRAPVIDTPFVLGAFGVLYLRKGQKVDLFTGYVKTGDPFTNQPGAWFSMARLLAPAQGPGLFQTLKDFHRSTLHRGEPVISYRSTAEDQLAYVQGEIFNPNTTLERYEDVTITMTGTYLVSLIITIVGKVP